MSEHPAPVLLEDLAGTDGHEKRRAILGMTGSQKSSLVKGDVVAYQRKRLAHIVVDIHDEYTPFGIERRRCPLGSVRMRMTVSEFLEALDKDESFFLASDLSLAVVPDELSEDPRFLKAELERWVNCVRHRRSGPVKLIFEETGFYADACEELLYAIWAGWRKEDVFPDFVGQRWTMFPAAPRSQTDELTTARQWKRRDLQELRNELGEAARCVIGRLHMAEGTPSQYVRLNLSEPADDVLADT